MCLLARVELQSYQTRLFVWKHEARVFEKTSRLRVRQKPRMQIKISQEWDIQSQCELWEQRRGKRRSKKIHVLIVDWIQLFPHLGHVKKDMENNIPRRIRAKIDERSLLFQEKIRGVKSQLSRQFALCKMGNPVLQTQNIYFFMSNLYKKQVSIKKYMHI